MHRLYLLLSLSLTHIDRYLLTLKHTSGMRKVKKRRIATRNGRRRRSRKRRRRRRRRRKVYSELTQ